VGPGKISDLTGYVSDFIRFSSADPNFFIDNLAAHEGLLEGRKKFFDFRASRPIGIKSGDNILLQRVINTAPLEFIGGVENLIHPGCGNLPDLGHQGGIYLHLRDLALGFSGRFLQLFLQIDERLQIVKRIKNAGKDLFLTQLIGLSFHHDNGIAGAGDDNIHRRCFEFGNRRVQHIFPVNIANSTAGHGAIERDIGNHQST